MRLLLALALLLLPLVAFAKDPACARSCDELLKPLLAECRESGGGDHHGKDEEHDAAEACKNNATKLRAACLKQCASEAPKKRR